MHDSTWVQIIVDGRIVGFTKGRIYTNYLLGVNSKRTLIGTCEPLDPMPAHYVTRDITTSPERYPSTRTSKYTPRP